MRKHNEGFTLVELIVVIAIGTLVTAAATTLLLMGMRINLRSSRLATSQNTTQLLMEVMVEIAAEEAYDLEGDWMLTDEKKEPLVSFHDKAIYLRNTELLTEVETSTAEQDGKLVTITIKMEDGREYSTTVYCRFLDETPPPDTGASLNDAYLQQDYREVLTFALEHGENSPEVTEFLKVLASQYGSRGQILDAQGNATGEYFSQWYIGSYAENPGWDENTPWCACYLSWAMAQCAGLEEPPRYANVDTYWMDVVTEQTWTPYNPAPGDIVFFDWIVDADYDPQHVGAVLAVADGWLYTIEGNSGNRVTLCRYDLTDPCILGYAKLNWN